MLARYNVQSVKKTIDECYLYWHYNTDKTFDVFWCDYGEYTVPEGSHIIPVVNGDHLAYFDLRAFTTAKNELNNLVKGKYNDHLQLILVNYYNGALHFDESVRVDLEDSTDGSKPEIRGFMEWLTSECRSDYDVASLVRKMRLERFKSAIKRITLSDIIDNMIGVIGIMQ